MKLGAFGVVVPLLVFACAAPRYPYPETARGPSARAPVAAGSATAEPAGGDPHALDASISRMTDQIQGMNSQIATLSQRISQYRNTPGYETQALEAQQQRDSLQMQRDALSERQGSLQIIRNSMQPRTASPPIAPPALHPPPTFPPPTPIH